MKTAEEMLNSHAYLKTWTENPDDSAIEVCNVEQALWAMEEYHQERMRELKMKVTLTKEAAIKYFGEFANLNFPQLESELAALKDKNQ